MIPRFGAPVFQPGTIPEIGPDKNHLPTATCFRGYIPAMLRDAVQHDLGNAGEENHLGDSIKYPISTGVSWPGYRQIMLQEFATDGSFERDYTRDIGSLSVQALRLLYPDMNFYRTRLLVLDAGHEVPWHVDASPREFCRVHWIIQGSAHWQFRRKGQTMHARMREGSIWWTSVGWPHTVANIGSNSRIVLITHMSFQDMVKTFGEPIEHAMA